MCVILSLRVFGYLRGKLQELYDIAPYIDNVCVVSGVCALRVLIISGGGRY